MPHARPRHVLILAIMTLATLVDIHEITELKYRYARTLDNKLWDEFADTLTEDVQATYGTAVQIGRASCRERV